MDYNRNEIFNQTDATENCAIINKKISERFYYSNSLNQPVEKSNDGFFLKIKKKKLGKYSRTFSDKVMSHSNTSLNKLDLFSSKNENWQIVQEALTNALLGKNVKNLNEVLGCIRQVDEQFANNNIVDYYQTHILKNTLQKLQRQITNAKVLEERWIQFFRKSLPNVILIMSPLKTQQEFIERVSLYEFKRRLTKVEDLKKKLMTAKNDISKDWSVLQHMFLVLHATKKFDNEVSDIDVEFEEIGSILISPIIGYSGIFINGQRVYNCNCLKIQEKTFDSDSTRYIKKVRGTLNGIFKESKSLWDISGKF